MDASEKSSISSTDNLKKNTSLPRKTKVKEENTPSLTNRKNDIISYSKTGGQMITATHTWKIFHFWDMYYKFPLESKPTVQMPFRFMLRRNNTEDNLSLYIFSETQYSVLCSFSVKNSSLNSFIMINDLKEEKQIGTIPIKFLLKNTTEFMPDDALTICIECQWYTNVSHNNKSTIISQSHVELQTDIAPNNIVLDKNSLVTFTIDNDNRQLYANKNLLSAKNTVFQAMFDSQMKESITNEVQSDMTYDILKLLLCYIQYSLLPDLDINNVKMLAQLCAAADKYDEQNLKVMCELQLIKLAMETNCKSSVKIACTEYNIQNTKYLNKYITQDTFKQSNHHRHSYNIYDYELKDSYNTYNNELKEVIKNNYKSLLKATKNIETSTTHTS